jgi:hypothetical protein
VCFDAFSPIYYPYTFIIQNKNDENENENGVQGAFFPEPFQKVNSDVN